jgi:hypothetical protein
MKLLIFSIILFGYLFFILSITGCSRDQHRKNHWYLDTYRMEATCEIQKKWISPSDLSEDEHCIYTLIVLNIMPDGSLEDIVIVRRSGNDRFDKSAYDAVLNSNPVKPHPEEFTFDYVNPIVA